MSEYKIFINGEVIFTLKGKDDEIQALFNAVYLMIQAHKNGQMCTHTVEAITYP